MPVYEYRCDACGVFEQRRDSAEATAPVECPSCAGNSRRIYTPPGVPSRAGARAGANAVDRGRIDRALTGEPQRTGPPSGTRLPSAPHTH